MSDNSNVINLGTLEVSNNYADYYGFDWLKVYDINSVSTIKNAGNYNVLMNSCQIPSITSFKIL